MSFSFLHIYVCHVKNVKQMKKDESTSPNCCWEKEVKYRFFSVHGRANIHLPKFARDHFFDSLDCVYAICLWPDMIRYVSTSLLRKYRSSYPSGVWCKIQGLIPNKIFFIVASMQSCSRFFFKIFPNFLLF